MDHSALTSTGAGLSRSGVRLGSPRLRVSRWQGDRYTALIGPGRTVGLPSSQEIHRAMDALRERGVYRAVTPALNQRDAMAFVQAGFVIHEHLHLLARGLQGIAPPEPTRRLSAGRAWHRSSVIGVDQSAFEPFWQFDERALSEARRATPRHRYRVAQRVGSDKEPHSHSDVAGYAITGLAGRRGYLQRLAVRPEFSGLGLGTDLVHDACHWLMSKGARSVLVNTQERNQRALGLYEHLGFIRQPDGLVVLQWRAP